MKRLLAVVAGLAIALVGTMAVAAWLSTGTGSATVAAAQILPPTAVIASQSAGTSSVDVGWSAPAIGVAPSGYRVSRVPTGGSPVSVCGTGSMPVTGTSCSDTSVPDGTYAYVVTSVIGSWTSGGALSSPVTVTTSVGTTTSVNSSANPSVVGQTLTYTAIVTQASGSTTPTGTVTFKDGASPITCIGGTQTLSSGSATCSVSYASAGTHSITAVYPGSGVFTGSASSTFTQNVNKASTTTLLTSSVNPSVTGQDITFTATVAAASPGSGSPAGTVSFSDGGNVITCAAGTQTLNGAGVATCQVPFGTAGTKTVTATYAGSSNYLSSTSANSTQIVNKAATTTAVATSNSTVKSGVAVTYTAAVYANNPGVGTPAGTVTFKDGTTTISCGGGNQTLDTSGVATCQMTYASTSAHSISAVYSGDSNYQASTSAPLTQQVVNGVVTGLGFANVTVSGSPVILSTSNCTGLGSANVVCTVSGGNNASLGADVRFVNAGNALTAYSVVSVQGLSNVETKNASVGGTVDFATTGSGSQRLTGSKTGNDHVYFTVTYSDGVNTFKATLKMD